MIWVFFLNIILIYWLMSSLYIFILNSSLNVLFPNTFSEARWCSVMSCYCLFPLWWRTVLVSCHLFLLPEFGVQFAYAITARVKKSRSFPMCFLLVNVWCQVLYLCLCKLKVRYDRRDKPSSIFLHRGTQLSQHHLLKRLPFPHCVLLLTLPKSGSL